MTLAKRLGCKTNHTLQPRERNIYQKIQICEGAGLDCTYHA